MPISWKVVIFLLNLDVLKDAWLLFLKLKSRDIVINQAIPELPSQKHCKNWHCFPRIGGTGMIFSKSGTLTGAWMPSVQVSFEILLTWIITKTNLSYLDWFSSSQSSSLQSHISYQLIQAWTASFWTLATIFYVKTLMIWRELWIKIC